MCARAHLAHEHPSIQASERCRTGSPMRTYNLFRSKRACHFVCAVAEDWAVPTFIDAGGWEFAGHVREPDRRPIGFDLRAAAESSRFHGFYLFQSFGIPGSDKLPGPRPGPRVLGLGATSDASAV